MPIRVGVVGTGGIASRHLENLTNESDVLIAGLCDIDEQKVREAASKFGAEPFTDYIQMFNEAGLDMVLICTPPGFRRQPIAEAAARGIACFIEKPPATNLAEAAQISKIVAETGIISGVGFMYRYSGAVQKAKALISGLPIPMLRSIYVCGVALNPNWPRWFFTKSISGGPILDQAIHILDSSRYLVSETAGDVAEIHSFGSNVTLPKEGDFTIEDSHVINLKYQNGTIQSHSHSWAISPNQVRIELLSKDYHLIVDLNPEPGRHRSALTGHIKNESIHFDFTEEDFYINEMKAFLQAVRTKDQSLIRSPYADAAKTLEVVFKANQAVEEGTVIKLT
jgi:predicted dehydrogenase